MNQQPQTQHQKALLDTALAVRAAGVSLVPVSAVTKKPIEALLPFAPDKGHGSWSEYQQRQPTEDEIRYWIAMQAQIAVVGGAVSGGLLIIDFDDPDKFEDWQKLAHRYTFLPVQKTGGGGYQVFLRCPNPGKNDKLAYVPDASKFDGRSIAIETRGEGGYAIIPPSLHPSGNHYQLINGDLSAIPTLTQEQADELLAMARSLCEAPYTTQQIQAMHDAMYAPTANYSRANGSANVIDQFNAAYSIETVLHDVGYTQFSRNRWIPPGAPRGRDSVQVFDQEGKAYHWDTDYPLSDGHAHDAFDIWCYYKHYGDIKAAVRDAAGMLCLPTIQPQQAAPANPPPPPHQPSQPVQQAFHPLLIGAPCTDAGNAECLAALHGDELRYCRTNKQWFAWSQSYWQPDSTNLAVRLMLKTVRERRFVSGTVADPDAAKKLFAWTYTSEMTTKIKAALEAATSMAEFDTTINDYDQDAMLVGLPNGVLDLRNCTYRQSKQSDMITMRLGTQFDPQAHCPRWQVFMNEVFAGDADLIAYVQRMFGYSLTGSTAERKFFLCFGDGWNGKSVLLDILSELMKDYAATAAFATFDADKRNESTNDLAALKGKRVVVISETNQDRRLNEALIKRLTGKQDKVTCRFLHKEFFEYRPTFKIWMAMNHLPIIKGQDKGIWSRVHIIPFTQDFEKRDNKDLTDQLMQELPGILNWALQGLKDWRQQGLNPPEIVLKHVTEYRQSSDTIGQFLDEYMVDDPTSWITAEDAYGDFYHWSRNRGELRPMSAISFGKVINGKGYISRRTLIDARKQTVYDGLRRRNEHDL